MGCKNKIFKENGSYLDQKKYEADPVIERILNKQTSGYIFSILFEDVRHEKSLVLLI